MGSYIAEKYIWSFQKGTIDKENRPDVVFSPIDENKDSDRSSDKLSGEIFSLNNDVIINNDANKMFDSLITPNKIERSCF